MRGGAALRWLPVGAILLFLFAPVAIVVLFSFNSVPSTALPFRGFSLRWYREVFGDDGFRTAARHSVEVALASSAFSVVAGTAAAFALAGRRSKLLGLASLVVLTPLVTPGLMIGVALLVFAAETSFEPSLRLVFVGHALITIPFVVLVVAARLENFDRSVVEAARDLGAGPVEAFARVVLPAIGPAVIGAALLSLAWSLDEFVITLFTNGGNPTLPVLIWTRATKTGLDPGINAIASVILLMTILAALVASKFLRPSQAAR